MEQKIDQIKRELDDDRLALDSLRHSADAQNEIVVLKEQCEKDLEAMEDALREHSYNLQKYNIPGIRASILGSNDDDDGSQLLLAVEEIQNAVRTKYDDSNTKLDKFSSDVSKTERIVSEKKALLASSHRTISSHKSKLQSLAQSVAEVKKAVDDLRRHEAGLGLTLSATIETPKELLMYVDERLEELEDDDSVANIPKVARKIFKRLKRMVSLLCDAASPMVKCLTLFCNYVV